MRLQWKGQQDQIYQTRRVENRNNCPSYHQFDFHKMINQGEGSQQAEAEESQEEVISLKEDSLEEEDSQEEEAGYLEVEAIPEEEEDHPEDHQEARGGHRQF